MNLDQSIQLFIDYITNEQRLAKGTINNYTTDLHRFESFLKDQHITKLEEVSEREIRSWQLDLMSTKHSPRTTNRALCSLRSWYRFLRKKEYTTFDPFQKITSVKTDKHLPIFFKENEVEKIYSADLYPDTFNGQRDRLLLRILYETGIRRAEVTTLTEANFDPYSNTIKVRGKRNKERIIPIENELSQNIQRFITLKKTNGINEEALLTDEKGQPLSPSKVYTLVKHYMTLISNANRISPHTFRHTFATHMLNEGANIDAIKELLGHTDLKATEVYTHVTREHLKETYKHAHPRANTNSKKEEI